MCALTVGCDRLKCLASWVTEAGWLASHMRIASRVGSARAFIFTDTCAAILRWASAGSEVRMRDRKSTRLNSSHVKISYAVFCLTSGPLISLLFPYTTLFRSDVRADRRLRQVEVLGQLGHRGRMAREPHEDRQSGRVGEGLHLHRHVRGDLALGQRGI